MGVYTNHLIQPSSLPAGRQAAPLEKPVQRKSPVLPRFPLSITWREVSASGGRSEGRPYIFVTKSFSVCVIAFTAPLRGISFREYTTCVSVGVAWRPMTMKPGMPMDFRNASHCFWISGVFMCDWVRNVLKVMKVRKVI